MPKHIPTDKEGKSVHRRKDGYELEYFNPHSPFQRLISAAMARKQLSFRGLGQKIDVSATTLWAWLHNKNGFPSERSFVSATHIPQLARHLNLDEDTIRKSIDLSRIQFSEGLIPDPLPLMDAFSDFIAILEEMPGDRVYKSKILTIARRMHAGAQLEVHGKMSRAPKSKNSPPKSKVKTPKAKKPATKKRKA